MASVEYSELQTTYLPKQLSHTIFPTARLSPYLFNMSGEVVYNLPKKQLTNTTFTNLLASSTGDSPYADSNVVSGRIVATGDEVPNSQKVRVRRSA